MSKKYIEQAFLIDDILCRNKELVDHVIESKKTEMGRTIVDLLSDGEPYICEMAIKTHQEETVCGRINRLFLTYEHITRCGTCRFWRPMNAVVGVCQGKMHDQEVAQSDYCSYGDRISDREIQFNEWELKRRIGGAKHE